MIQHVAGIEFTENIEASLWERKCVLGPLYVVWTFPPGYINCPLSSPGPKPVSWPSDGTPTAFTQALRLHYEVLWIQHSQSGVFFASVFLFSYFHNLWSLQPLSPSHLNRWLQVPVQLGPPKAALLVFLPRCSDRVSNNFPPSWHAWQGLPKPRFISLIQPSAYLSHWPPTCPVTPMSPLSLGSLYSLSAGSSPYLGCHSSTFVSLNLPRLPFLQSSGTPSLAFYSLNS